MYTKATKITTDKTTLSNYIEGFDVYNSTLLTKLFDPLIDRELYEIVTYEYRPDLIAEDYYGSSTYAGLVLLICGTGLENYTKGTKLWLIPKSDLDSILNDI